MNPPSDKSRPESSTEHPEQAQQEPQARKLATCHAWCWQEKALLRRIREAFDADKTVASALGVYAALTEIASDEQSEEFTTTHLWIAQKCGYSQSTVQHRVCELARIGIVQVTEAEPGPLRGPSTYRLLALSNGCGATLSNDCGTLSSGCTTLSNGPKKRRYCDQKNIRTISGRTGEEAAAPAAPPTSEDSDKWIAELQGNPAYERIDVKREFHKMTAWCQAHGKRSTLRRFVNWLIFVIGRFRNHPKRRRARPLSSRHLPLTPTAHEL